MAGGVDDGKTYSWLTAAIYVFNLIVGVGCLTLPHAFKEAGLLLSVIFLVLFCIAALITATWVVEAMASANALLIHENKIKDGAVPTSLLDEAYVEDHEGVADRLLSKRKSESLEKFAAAPVEETFHLDNKVEVGHMALIFGGVWAQRLVLIVMVVYLIGDLAIYAVYVPNSITSITGSFSLGSWHLSKDGSAYYVFLTLFVIVVTPFCFFNFQKTKYMQYGTLAIRNIAFVVMIILAIYLIGKGDGSSDIKIADVTNAPTIFGATIYSFMCHHSIPGFITPIDRKRKMTLLFVVDFLAIFTAYLLLGGTAIFAFKGVIPSTYTTAFEDQKDVPTWLADVLAMYPVFTLTSNFPLIAITMRNNIDKLVPHSWLESNNGFPLRRVVLTLITVAPPIAIAYGVHDVGLLVDITGAFPGMGIMYGIPLALAFMGRRKVMRVFGSDIKHQFCSPFRHLGWNAVIVVWSAFALVLTIIKFIMR
mmetsp:Transcript_46590/g.117310  ORF Transcript_46590/g.117310 Transcript_46590/m.117310 type:complete len:478 (-) Transcript_46590:102-1535(-)